MDSSISDVFFYCWDIKNRYGYIVPVSFDETTVSTDETRVSSDETERKSKQNFPTFEKRLCFLMRIGLMYGITDFYFVKWCFCCGIFVILQFIEICVNERFRFTRAETKI